MERISGRQLMLIGIAYTLDATLISVPSQVIHVSKMDSWLSYIAAMTIVAFSLWLLSRVMAKHPSKDLFEIMIAALPFIGRVIALLYIAYFFFILTRDVRMVIDFTNITLLPRTPIIVISILVVFTAFLVARGGIEIVARMTELWLPSLIIIVLLIPITLLKDFDFRFLMPFFSEGVQKPIVEGGWYLLPYIGEVIALPFLFANQTFHLKFGMKALLAGTSLLLILNYCIILTLGIYIPPRILYPTYEMVRQIRITDFLDRLDLPLVGIYMPTMLAKIAFSLYFVCHGIKRVFPTVSAKHMTMPFSILAYVCAYWFFSSALQLVTFNRSLPVMGIVFVLFLPILLFILIRGKNRDKTKLIPQS